MALFVNVVKDSVKVKRLFCKCWSDFEASIKIVAMIGHKMKLVIAMECHDCVKNYAINQWETQITCYLADTKC